MKNKFNKWQSIFWPIHKYELKKFLPMAFMMFCILFNFSILRSIKDSLIVTSIGAEAIPILKLWFVLPFCIIFTAIYLKLINTFKKNTVFYIITIFFIMYFAIFITFLYPNHKQLHANFSIQNVHFQYLKEFMKLINIWVFSSFYAISELWGSVMIGLIFWKFANDITSLNESKRFYVMFGLIADVALIIAGSLIKTLSISSKSLNSEKWKTLPIIICIIIIVCFIITILYYYLTCKILNNDVAYLKSINSTNNNDSKNHTKRLSLLKSLKCIYKSKYIRYIATLVICYGISINLVEVVWKGQVGLLYITKASYSSFMGSLQIITGIVTILCMIIGSNIIRKTSWFTAAIITPIVILTTGLFFFVFIMFKDHIIKTILNSELATLNIIIFVGFVQNCTTKGMKYSLFDSTKEMSYIPLDDDLKSSGKAVADGIGLSIGKSGGSLILYILLNVIFIGSTLIQLVPIIAIIFIAIVILWVSSVIKLNKKFKKLYSNNI